LNPRRCQIADLPPLGDNHRDWPDDNLDDDKNVTKERNKKRRKTALIIDVKNPLIRNINFHLPQLVSFLMNNFQCHRCCSANVVPTIEVETFGFVTGINYCCGCGHHSSIRPDLLQSSKEKLDKLDRKLKPGEAFSSDTNAIDFELNCPIVLGFQMSQNGCKEGSILSRMINLDCNPMRNQWREMQEYMGKLFLEIAEEVLEENLEIQTGLSPSTKDD
jgi:hypothetical protein